MGFAAGAAWRWRRGTRRDSSLKRTAGSRNVAPTRATGGRVNRVLAPTRCCRSGGLALASESVGIHEGAHVLHVIIATVGVHDWCIATDGVAQRSKGNEKPHWRSAGRAARIVLSLDEFGLSAHQGDGIRIDLSAGPATLCGGPPASALTGSAPSPEPPSGSNAGWAPPPPASAQRWRGKR